MNKVIFILVHGMSFGMMNYPDLIELSLLKGTELDYVYPECMKYYDIWKQFDLRSFLDPGVDKARKVNSDIVADMINTGLTRNYMEFNNVQPEMLCSKLKSNGIKTAALTNVKPNVLEKSDSCSWDFFIEEGGMPLDYENNLDARFSKLAVELVEVLDQTNSDWFFFIELGIVDSLSYSNTVSPDLGKLLEIYRFIYLLSEKEKSDEYTIVLTGDPGTDTSNLSDASMLFDDVGMINRKVVPFLVNKYNNNLINCKYHYDLYYSIMHQYNIEVQNSNCKKKLIIITGAPGSGKSATSKLLKEKLNYAYIKGDDYLNFVNQENECYDDNILDVVIANILHDCEMVINNINNVVLDFVFLREQEIVILEKLMKKYRLYFVILKVTEETALQRDLLRPREEQMGERCALLAKEYNDMISSFECLNPILPDCDLTPEEIVVNLVEIINKCD